MKDETNPWQMLLDDCDGLLATMKWDAHFPRRSAERIGTILP